MHSCQPWTSLFHKHICICLFQSPSNVVRYEIQEISSEATKYFQIDSVTGVVYIKLPAVNDNSRTSVYHFNMMATDQGSPMYSAEFPARVSITVVRNLHAPAFIGMPYESTLNFDVHPGTVVYNTTAFDDDSHVRVLLY
jgi:hypothetical protein